MVVKIKGVEKKDEYICAMKKEWFASWFDSPYYHLLYKNRDDCEAKSFISTLVDHLQLPQHSRVLDLACGKGRHSVTLSSIGFDVLGVDLSPNSIEYAKRCENERLSFRVHDMREVMEGEKFDVVFNLFTSFGYFDDTQENITVLSAIHTMLHDNGLLIIDFMNARKVIEQLVPSETKQIDNITFNLERRYDGNHIFKDIRFQANENNYHYTERVQAIAYNDFERWLTTAGFEILRTFGNFDLAPFDENNSDRLIIVARKK